MDKHLRVELIEQTANPQRVINAAMHQDYSEDFVYDELFKDSEIWKNDPEKSWQPTGKFVTQWDEELTEQQAGDRVVKHLLKGNRGHYGPLEHPQIILNCGWFPHSTMQQIRTHRIGVSFDVQSGRYTGQRLYSAGVALLESRQKLGVLGYREGVWHYDEALKDRLKEVVYFRPEGAYNDRGGNRYDYTPQAQINDMALAALCLEHYVRNIDRGHSEEHARGLIPFDVRQHWVMSANVRSLMHLLDLRWKADAQLECQWLCDLIWPHFAAWVPDIAAWYLENRAKKARLAP